MLLKLQTNVHESSLPIPCWSNGHEYDQAFDLEEVGAQGSQEFVRSYLIPRFFLTDHPPEFQGKNGTWEVKIKRFFARSFYTGYNTQL